MRLLRRERADPLGAAGVDRVRAILFLGGVPADALDDGVQQVRLKLLEREARKEAPLENPHAWIGVVASHVATDFHRARQRERGLTERIAARPTVDSSHPQEEATLAAAIARGLDDLPDSQRQILVLRFYSDLSVKEIAEQLGIAEGTVKSRLHHAVKAIRKRLQALEVI